MSTCYIAVLVRETATVHLFSRSENKIWSKLLPGIKEPSQLVFVPDESLVVCDFVGAVICYRVPLREDAELEVMWTWTDSEGKCSGVCYENGVLFVCKDNKRTIAILDDAGRMIDLLGTPLPLQLLNVVVVLFEARKKNWTQRIEQLPSFPLVETQSKTLIY